MCQVYVPFSIGEKHSSATDKDVSSSAKTSIKIVIAMHA